MHLQLRRCGPHRAERGNGGDLAGAQIEAGTAVDVTEREFKEIGGEIGRDIGERCNDLFAGLAVDLSERALAPGEPAFGIGQS